LPRKSADTRRSVKVTEVENQLPFAEDAVDSVEHVAA
jgi:hypothetical protein